MDSRDETHVAPPLIEARGVSKSYPGVQALLNVCIEVRPGEIVALTGENGSGKSTLSKLIGGWEQPDSGVLLIDGVETTIPSSAVALQKGIVMISQELTLAPTLTVAENIYLGRWPRGRAGSIDWRELRRAAIGILERLDVHVGPDEIVGQLSVELQQEVEIARAIASNPRLLILDEATSSLSEAATTRLLELVRSFAERGVGVLMISHRMPEVYGTAGRAYVLRDGELVGSIPLPQTPEPELVRMMVGRELRDYYGTREHTSGEVALEVRDLRTPDGHLKETSFKVRHGEILGIAGLVGSGKSHVGMALGGAIQALGSVDVTGVPLQLGRPARALEAGVGYIPDDRKRSAIFPTLSLSGNMTITWLRRISRAGVIRTRLETAMVKQSIEKYGIKTSSPLKPITQLSGGNQQKAILGRIFDLGASVLVLNEPTRGVDVGAKSAIYQLIQQRAEAGAAVVLISSELPELIGLSDRILVFFEGQVRGEFSGADMEEQRLNDVAVSGRVHGTDGSKCD